VMLAAGTVVSSPTASLPATVRLPPTSDLASRRPADDRSRSRVSAADIHPTGPTTPMAMDFRPGVNGPRLNSACRCWACSPSAGAPTVKEQSAGPRDDLCIPLHPSPAAAILGRPPSGVPERAASTTPVPRKELFYTTAASPATPVITHWLDAQPEQSFQLIWPCRPSCMTCPGFYPARKPRYRQRMEDPAALGDRPDETVSGHTQFPHDGCAAAC
jgi:hypothetical protein